MPIWRCQQRQAGKAHSFDEQMRQLGRMGVSARTAGDTPVLVAPLPTKELCPLLCRSPLQPTLQAH